MRNPDKITDYKIPRTTRLRRRLMWRLRRMRGAVDVETLDVFEHELAAFERAGVAELDRQRTHKAAAYSAHLAQAQSRVEDIRRALERTDADIRRAEQDLVRVDAKLIGGDPELHSLA